MTRYLVLPLAMVLLALVTMDFVRQQAEPFAASLAANISAQHP